MLAAAAAVSACGKTQARMPEPTPPLDVPAPPPRVVIPVTVKVPEPPPPDPLPVETPPARPPATAGAPPSRPPERTPPVVEPPPVLQTTSNTAAIEQKARDLVAAARRDLARVDRRKLGVNARDQFDTARRFIRMADEALATKNYLYAQQLAESAAALAGGLVKDPAIVL